MKIKTMKALLALLSFLLVIEVSDLSAQAYMPMLATKQWASHEVHPGPGSCRCYTPIWWINSGDTTIAGVTYTKILNPSLDSTMLVREDTLLRRVYQLKYGIEQILFSFNASTPGQIDTLNGQSCILDSITAYTFNSVARRKFTFHYIQGGNTINIEIIEGIGAINDGNLGIIFGTFILKSLCSTYDFTDNLTYSTTSTSSCAEYHATDIASIDPASFRIYPVPAAGSVTIASELADHITEVNLTDMLGRSIPTQLQRGDNAITVHTKDAVRGFVIANIKMLDGSIYSQKLTFE
jgi:hypothetical protein